MKNLTTVLFVLLSLVARADIFCPADRTLNCEDDLTNIDRCGYPIMTGIDVFATPRYIDENYLTQCDEGEVHRTWYIDKNGNGILDSHDISCIQVITLVRQYIEPIIIFPTDTIVSCLGAVEKVPPSILSGPCEHIGYDIYVRDFTVVEGACHKIHHEYTVINWCDYVESDPNSGGVWTHTRVIKVVDDEKPQISTCQHKVFGVENDCEAIVVLENSFSDIGGCPSEKLTWFVSVDLWADGTEDYHYGPNDLDEFKTLPIANGENVSIELPTKVGIGNHKIKWSVTDGCGNFRSCFTTFEVADIKSPTPYCLQFLSVGFEGSMDSLILSASSFDAGAFDNCTASEDLIFSFSSNIEDTHKTINCTNDGFKFYRIYVTDTNGNQEYCTAFALILDNGDCNSLFAPLGSMQTLDGSLGEQMPDLWMMDGGELIAQTSANYEGQYLFPERPLMTRYTVYPEPLLGDQSMVGIEDLVLLQKHLLGIISLDGYAQIAADVDGDHKVRLSDMRLMRDLILDETDVEMHQVYIPSRLDDENIENPEIGYLDYNGGFDYLSFTRGNISDLVEQVIDNEMIFDVSLLGNEITLTNQKEITLDGHHLTIPEEYGSLVTDLSRLEVNPEGKKYGVGEYEVKILGRDGYVEELLSELNSILGLVVKDTYKKANITFHTSSVTTATIDLADEILVYPNPSEGIFYIMEVADDIAIVDVNGRSISFAKATNGGDTKITLSTPENGLYFLSYKVRGEMRSEKLVLLGR